VVEAAADGLLGHAAADALGTRHPLLGRSTQTHPTNTHSGKGDTR
jgi:hypothetical protein